MNIKRSLKRIIPNHEAHICKYMALVYRVEWKSVLHIYNRHGNYLRKTKKKYFQNFGEENMIQFIVIFKNVCLQATR